MLSPNHMCMGAIDRVHFRHPRLHFSREGVYHSLCALRKRLHVRQQHPEADIVKALEEKDLERWREGSSW